VPESKKSDLQLALIYAGLLIEKLPEGCPYYLSAIEGEDVWLDIAPRSRDEFWLAASLVNQLPKKVEEVVKRIGMLEVSIELMEEEPKE
jgi:hypothetical protein